MAAKELNRLVEHAWSLHDQLSKDSKCIASLCQALRDEAWHAKQQAAAPSGEKERIYIHAAREREHTIEEGIKRLKAHLKLRTERT
ncbi:MAG: hypothetical protein GY854_32410 [Deltaproteobacteria bacterium]|nr:hypothetical protein [Deltaproteobacteria bacterium]